MGLTDLFRRSTPQSLLLRGNMTRLVTGTERFAPALRGLTVREHLECELRASPVGHEDWNSAAVFRKGRQIGWANVASTPEYPAAVKMLTDLGYRVVVPGEVGRIRNETVVRLALPWPDEIVEMDGVPDSVKRVLYRPEMDQAHVTVVGLSKLGPRISDLLGGRESARFPATIAVDRVASGVHAGKPQIRVTVDGEPFGLVPHSAQSRAPEVFAYAAAGNTSAQVEVRDYAKPWARLHVQTRAVRF